eukprot:jgi/Galph1/1405/GphlegSOOS_G101.1
MPSEKVISQAGESNEDIEGLQLKDLPPNSFIRRYSYGDMGGMSKEYHQPVKQIVNLGHPEALGLAGFAATDFMLSCINASLLPSSMTNSIIALAFFYGGSANSLLVFSLSSNKIHWRSSIL